jgi:hypothetical protein
MYNTYSWKWEESFMIALKYKRTPSQFLYFLKNHSMMTYLGPNMFWPNIEKNLFVWWQPLQFISINMNMPNTIHIEVIYTDP